MSLSTLRNATTAKGSSSKIVPPIPFEEPPVVKYVKHKYRKFKIPVSPGSEDKMAMEAYLFNTGTCKQYLTWKEQVEAILQGLQIDTH